MAYECLWWGRWVTCVYDGSFFLSFKFAKNINENESLAKKKDTFFLEVITEKWLPKNMCVVCEGGEWF